MRFKQVILSSATVASIVLTASLINPSVFSVVSEAQAASNVSVNVGFGTFYDRLAPYGSWVSYQDRYVWLPEHVSNHWRPYTEGHWSFTRRYGWLWVSDERFGWATYHYGRWGYTRDIGWYWVPGRRWAPAWVAWSHADNDIAWAPLPPRDNDEVTITISFGDIPDYYWQAVPVSAFLSVNLSGQISNDRDHVRTVVQNNPPQSVIIQNNIVVNNVIDVGFIEKQTKTKVIVLEEKPVNNPDAIGKTDGKTVTIFNPEVKIEVSAKPAATKKVEDVAKDRVAKGVPPLDTTVDQPKVPPKASDGTAAPAAKTDAPVVDSNAPKIDKNAPVKATGEIAPPAAKTDAPVVSPITPKTDKKAPVKANDGTSLPAAKIDAPLVDPNTPKTDKSAKTVMPQLVQPKVDLQKTDQKNVGLPVVEKKKLDAGTALPPDLKNTTKVPTIKQLAPVAPDKKQNNNVPPPKKKGDKSKVPCDPAVEACPPAQ